MGEILNHDQDASGAWGDLQGKVEPRRCECRGSNRQERLVGSRDRGRRPQCDANLLADLRRCQQMRDGGTEVVQIGLTLAALALLARESGVTAGAIYAVLAYVWTYGESVNEASRRSTAGQRLPKPPRGPRRWRCP